MNLVKFPVAATNIFPCSNSTAGGQLITEFNLRCRESVGTDPKVKYMIGPSFVHAKEDFWVSIQSDTIQVPGGDISQIPISSSVLEVSTGRGVINGHYIELLAPIVVDLAELNATAREEAMPPLKGDLSIGIRIMYSTEPTMTGAMLQENSDYYYEGVQLVVLPRSEFILPSDPEGQLNPAKITAHLKLADFTYTNGTIGPNIVNNYPDKCKSVDASRIGNFEDLLEGAYISKSKLDPAKLYVYAGKGVHRSTSDEPWTEGWCDALDSLMLWDANPTQVDQTLPNWQSLVSKKPEFVIAGNGAVRLIVPHKQIDQYILSSTSRDKVYYQDVQFDLPVADFASNTSGTVDAEYTGHVKEIREMVQGMYRLPAGKQRGYLEELNFVNSTATVKSRDLPPIGSTWNIGDYIVVNLDYTVDSPSDSARAPSTMYVVLPGKVTEINKVSSRPDGFRLGYTTRADIPSEESDMWNDYFDIDNFAYKGSAGHDYFEYIYSYKDESGAMKSTSYFFVVKTTSEKATYSNPVFLTGQIPLAQEDAVGGFYNVPTTAIDAGYVYRDENGHLRLLDYALLRSGTLAYQLGEDFTSPANLTTEEVQNYLNEYVNQRIAFPNLSHTQTADNPNVINITITLPKVEDGKTAKIDVYDIDTRFNTAVTLNILGEASDNTTIDISDCARIRIGNVSGTPKINLYRSCIYYDSEVINMLSTIYDMSLWYVRYMDTDPNLLVTGLTVEQYASAVTTESFGFWQTPSARGDNHYSFALKGITFDPEGVIVGCKILVKNNSSDVPTPGDYVVVSEFKLPQGSALTYPEKRMIKPMKVSGSFATAYQSINDSGDAEGLVMQKATFSAVSQTWDEYQQDNTINGTVTVYTESKFLPDVIGLNFNSEASTVIDGMNPNEFHMFEGGVIA